METTLYILIGVIIGWITKVPFLIKWYEEFENDRAYREKITLKLLRMEEDKKRGDDLA